jgi:uncharacterized membrane protein YfcA
MNCSARPILQYIFIMEILGYAAALLIGLSLGLIGAGGAILTVPVLVYLFHVTPLMATSYSLVIVGMVSFLGFIGYLSAKEVAVKSGLLFGLSSVVTVFFIRHFVIPRIPAIILSRGSITITFSNVTMLLFGLVMILAAVAMISKNNKRLQSEAPDTRPALLLLYGVFVGLITALLGAGGGFLLIPALVIFARLPMKTAVGTSLMIITLNSIFGVLADIGRVKLEMGLLIPIAMLAIAGLGMGLYLSRRINSSCLKTAFGWFVLLMGIYVLITELIN